MNGLYLAPGVVLPLDFVTESSAILAKKGAGKTNAAIVLLEEIYDAGVPVVSIDPKGDHWGVRATDGVGDGLPIPVFGGLHGDIPLESTAGAYIADLVREKRLSAILDVSEFTVGERARFLTAFAERFYRRPEKEPIFLVLEEAHEFIPQMVRGDEARMVGAFERMVKLGRHKGIGLVMVTQRSASLNKNVLTQADNLFLMRTTSPQDRAAAKAWLTEHDEGDILAELPRLETGETILLQPARGDTLRFQFRMRHTYDAGATPKVGETIRPPATIADVDLSAISEAMVETIEKSKADDPKSLRSQLAERNGRIADLEVRLERALAAQPEAVEVVVEVPILSDEEREQLAEIEGMLKGLAAVLPLHTGIVQKLEASAAVPRSVHPASPPRPAPSRAPAQSTPVSVQPAVQPKMTIGDREITPEQIHVREDGEWVNLTPMERSILTVLVQRGPSSRRRIGAFAGKAHGGGAFTTAMGHLSKLGLIEYVQGAAAITDSGRVALGPVEPLPTGTDLIDALLGKMTAMERAIFETLLNAWPNGLTRAEIGLASGRAAGGGAFTTAMGKLGRVELVRRDGNLNYVSDEVAEAMQG